ncbi:uncharacterized protein LOC128956426 isoform X2 [Oppia nitens]|uniref:uncharacterized protein LOC128956426 isoform X2 n=1 Tax=Oppia nitens TaxID=1686743 RepID=UPI0023DCA81B|nr:uncharacterized protein LOC128956426 isoform X2 [Oppia nitens]
MNTELVLINFLVVLSVVCGQEVAAPETPMASMAVNVESKSTNDEKVAVEDVRSNNNNNPQRITSPVIIVEAPNLNTPVVIVEETAGAVLANNTRPLPDGVKRCHTFRERFTGHCVSFPRFFRCLRDGGVVFPDFSGNCRLETVAGCCVFNFFTQLTS